MQAKSVRILVVVAALIGLNVLSAFLFLRLDLTAEKRYTLSAATTNLLDGLDDDLHVNVYLAGDLPPGFQRLENAVRETLDEFQATTSNQSVTYRFIDPTAITNEKEKTALFERLTKLGILPTNLYASEGGKRTEKLIFPGAVISYKGKEAAVLLLKGNKAATPEEQLNQSYEGVEFQLASAIRKLTQVPGSRRKVGLLANTRVPPSRFSDLLASVQENYDLFYVDLSKPGPITGVDALLVPKPDQPFTDDQIFKIDQFVVNGGRTMFFVDGQRVDSVNAQGNYAQPLNLNLDDLFFRWGVRVNRDLIKDLNCAAIPLNVGNMGDKPNIQLVPWRYYPIINNFGASPITRNLDALYARFASTLDTVRADGIRKTPLLLTSPYTTILKTPVLVGYNEAQQQPDPRTYNGGVRLVGCLLEGAFQSLYANRILPGDPRSAGFKASGLSSRVVICSDGDLVVNDLDYRRNVPYPLGYDRYTRAQFANKDFALNALDYLIDPNGVITARARTVALRPLDKIRINDERTVWQLLNILGPLVLIGAVGGVWQMIRKRKYGR